MYFFFSLSRRPNCSSHRGHNPLDGGGRLLLPLGLVHQRHAEVTEAERHALQDGLARVGPVFWKLCEKRFEKKKQKHKRTVDDVPVDRVQKNIELRRRGSPSAQSGSNK